MSKVADNIEIVRKLDFKAGDIVKHFKRETADLEKFPNAYLYEIIGLGRHTETDEPLVIYKALYSSKGKGLKKDISENSVWVRPAQMFYSEVDHEKYPSIKQQFRFEKVEKDEYQLPEVHTSDITNFYLRQSKENK